MEGDAGGGGNAFLAGAEGAEILRGFRDDVVVELDHDSTLELASDGDVQVAPRPGHIGRVRTKKVEDCGRERES